MNKNHLLIILILLAGCTVNNPATFLFDEDGFIQLQLSINGLQKEFIFDTCAEATIISKELAEELNLIPHRFITINNLEITEVVYIPSLEINGMKLNRVEAAVLDMNNETFKHSNLKGIIGLNVINLFVWDFNLKTNLFKIHKYNTNKEIDFLVINYQKVEPTGLPFIKLKTTVSESDSVFFDTGFTGFLSINNLKDTTGLSIERNMSYKKDIFGIKKTNVKIYSAKDFDLLGNKFDKVHLRVNVDRENKELIGNLFIQRFNRFIFDPINSKILLSKETD